MESLVFKSPTNIEIKAMRINKKTIEESAAESKAVVKLPRTVTFSGELTYVNNALLYRMAYGCCDEDGYEYYYNLFDLARDPSIIDRILRSMQ